MGSMPLIQMRPRDWSIVSDILHKHIPGYEVWAFGSRAKGKAKPYSDLDLVIVSDRPLALTLSAQLADAFSESDLPWRVDIVDWATTSSTFRTIIEQDKILLQPQGMPDRSDP